MYRGEMARKKPSIESVADWKGPHSLSALLVPIESLSEDPANLNTHDERSIASIAASYKRFGQQRPLVIDPNGIVRAGNGQLEAARKLGWSQLAVIVSDLTGIDLAAFALADNRTAEHSKRDELAVAKFLEALRSEPDFPIESTGYTDTEVDALLQKIGTDAAAEPATQATPERWMVVIDCDDEHHQLDLLKRFSDEGMECRAIVS